MIVINPKYRHVVEIRGEKWTLRPLTWQDEMSISDRMKSEGWKAILSLAVVDHPKFYDPQGNEMPLDFDALPLAVITRLLQESDKITHVGEDDAKNYSSSEPCSEDSTKATTSNASNASDLPTTESDGTLPSSQVSLMDVSPTS